MCFFVKFLLLDVIFVYLFEIRFFFSPTIFVSQDIPVRDAYYNLSLHCVVIDITKRDVVNKNETISCSSTEYMGAVVWFGIFEGSQTSMTIKEIYILFYLFLLLFCNRYWWVQFSMVSSVVMDEPKICYAFMAHIYVRE